ncbi:MAG: hypothetical protein R2838_21370 [Caldilineaceae bacterium]
MHFTWGARCGRFIPGDPYHNVVAGFKSIPTTVFYLLAVTALGFHLYHGTWSMIQTLGFLEQPLRYGAPVRSWRSAVIIAGGLALVPWP